MTIIATVPGSLPSGGDAGFERQLLSRLGEAALDYAYPAVLAASGTLAKGLNFFAETDNLGYIQIPHYWAIYVHDGRGPFSMPAGTVMCWFRDPALDPRLRSGHSPVRRSDLRRLTKEEFRFWVLQNQLADPTGEHPELRPMVVTRSIRKATEPTPFFSNDAGGGMAGFEQKANEIGTPLARAGVRDLLKSILDIEDRAKGSI